MSAQSLKDTYYFYFPQTEEGVKAFNQIAVDIAGGSTMIYPAVGTWIDPSGITVQELVTVVTVSGNFQKDETEIMENEFHNILKDMGEHSGFYNRNGIGHIKVL